MVFWGDHMAMTKKEALLKAAKELFGECGYTETTFKKISERAGVALGLLTHHYGNKEKLFSCRRHGRPRTLS